MYKEKSEQKTYNSYIHASIHTYIRKYPHTYRHSCGRPSGTKCCIFHLGAKLQENPRVNPELCREAGAVLKDRWFLALFSRHSACVWVFMRFWLRMYVSKFQLACGMMESCWYVYGCMCADVVHGRVQQPQHAPATCTCNMHL